MIPLHNLRKTYGGATGLAGFAAAAVVLGIGVGQVTALPGDGGDAAEAAYAGPSDPESLRFFEDHVRPILADRCVRCHGGEKIAGDLNMASRNLLLAGGNSGSAIDWQQLDKSLLLTAISYRDVNYEMPPTGKLPEAEIETLKRWVMMGLPWTAGEAGNLADPSGEGADHHGPISIEEGRAMWQYNPVEKPAVPQAAAEDGWSDHPIDAFIYDKLKVAGLEPNAQADKRTLIRRATYDLTGLPPTLEEVGAFVNDDRPDAWERVIDRLLASPHYGEKWARHWMDIVRYAETNGYERDGTKLNMWRYRDYLIRAFNQDKPYDRFVLEHVAGDELPDRDADSILATGYQRLQIWDDEPTDKAQARADYIADIVDTTGSTFMGMSIGCARCHDHKKDPITQEDYYSLYAFFNNVTEFDRGSNRSSTRDLADVPTPDVAEAERKRLARIEALSGKVKAIEARFLSDWKIDENLDTQTVIRDARRGEPEKWHVSFEEHDGWELQGFDHLAWPEKSAGFGTKVGESRPGTEWNTDEIYLRKRFRIADQTPSYIYLTLMHDEDVAVYINGILVYEAAGFQTQYQTIQLPPEASQALVVGSNSIAVSCKQTVGGQYIDVGMGFGIVDREAVVDEALDREGKAILGEQTVQQYQQMRAELGSLRNRPLIRPYPATVIRELSRQAPQEYIHQRGSVHGQGEPVNPGYPDVLGGGDAKPVELPGDVQSSGQRLALGRWLIQPDHPLTARVMVNRMWQHNFGKGIVESSSEFGSLGTGATYPELLDYLATYLVDSGWSLKDLHRLMLTSETYRMSSSAQQAGLEKDPINTLLWRYNMRRLTAEEFRDSVLLVNGSLNRQLFGPSVFTPMPKEVLATSSKPEHAWGKSSPEQQDRRSIYIFVKRSLREPLLAALDQAETDTPCPVRFSTTVPTQSLITLNGDFVQDEAKIFAKRLQAEAGDNLESQVKLGLRLVFGQEPEPEQVIDNLAFLRQVQAEHGLSNERALQLFGVVCFNLNEFMYID